MPLKVTTLTLGQLNTNCYLITDTTTSHTAIIDPADAGDFLCEHLLQNHLSPQFILLTHGHFDHCLGATDIAINFQIPIYLDSKDIFLYQRAASTAKHFTRLNSVQPPASTNFPSSQVLTLGKYQITLTPAPGHTPGSYVFSAGDFVFTGDTLLPFGEYGEHHSYSKPLLQQKSIQQLKQLFPQSQIFPGHGEPFFV